MNCNQYIQFNSSVPFHVTNNIGLYIVDNCSADILVPVCPGTHGYRLMIVHVMRPRTASRGAIQIPQLQLHYSYIRQHSYGSPGYLISVPSPTL